MVHLVALYARVSTSDQSCSRQLNELEDYANRSSMEVVGVFKETGSGAKNNRTERRKILELARQRKLDLILVSELSRWGRSSPDLRGSIEQLAECGFALRALNGPDFDISTAQGKLMLNLLASISEFERDLLRERIKSGMAHARSKGTKSGRPIGWPPFKQPERVKRLLEENKSVRTIANELSISKTTVMKIKGRNAKNS